ncbi:MAG TPA: hypothetical protein VED40_14450 [Azospirillaceae bacterium]|nr:hypothetical protein [Azospirillaceae bacterium]
MLRRLVLGLLVALPLPALADTLPPQRAEYRAAATLSVNGEEVRGTVAHARGMERRETVQDGLRSVLIVRPEQGEAFVLQPESGAAMRLDSGDPEAAPDLAALQRLPAVAEGKEKVAGLDTTRYRVSGGNEEGGFDGMVWATSDGIYARVEGAATDGGEPVRLRMELAEVKRGAQDPTLFELPPGTSLMSFDPIPGRIPEVFRGGGKD